MDLVQDSHRSPNLGAAQVTLTAEEVARIDAALDGMDLAVFGGHARA